MTGCTDFRERAIHAGGTKEFDLYKCLRLAISARRMCALSFGLASFFQLLSASAAQAQNLSPGFQLASAGALTSDASETIDGKQSIKGEYFGTSRFTAYLRTNPAVILLASGRTYRATFRYKILSTPDLGFEVLFYSPTGGANGNFLPSYTIKGAAGSTGTATLTNTLGPFSDYEARWNVVGNGAIVIDDVQIVDVSTNSTVASEDAEGLAPQIRLAQAFLPPAQTGHTFSTVLAAWGGTPPYKWQHGIISLPPGVQLTLDGYLFGNPSRVGTYLFDVLATDALGASVRLPIRLTVSSGSSLSPPEQLNVIDGLAIVQPQRYQPAFRNPLGGMRPYVGPAKSHPFASLGRQYVEWNLLENSESDTVDKIRSATEKLFADLPSYNIKAVPRVYLIWPQPLAKYWPSDLAPDNYTSPEFRSRMRRLIGRLGEVWNKDPRIAFIETGIIGYWGEQHDPGFASSGLRPSLPPDMEREFGDAFLHAFPDKLLMNRYPRDLVNYPFGIHWDVLGSFDRGFWGNDTTGMTAELQKPAHIDRWKFAPRGGEIDPTFLGEPDFSQSSLQNVVRKYTSRLVDIIHNLHWNHVDVLQNLNSSDADLWDKASQIQNALGYRFVIDEADYSPVLQPGDGLTIRLKIENIGSSPLYYAWPLEVCLLDAKTRRLVWSSVWDGVDVRSWLPGTVVDITNTFAGPGNVPTGDYALAVSILDPSGMLPAARFAVVNYWMGGRTPIGPVSVGGVAPALQLNEFDDLQSDRSLYYLPPENNTSVRSFGVVDRGGLSLTTGGTGAEPISGYSRIQSPSGSTLPSGVAIFDRLNNGVLVSETGIPASTPLKAGRLYIEVAGAVSTGIALVNPNPSTATVEFFYTDSSGANLGAGITDIQPNSQIVTFLDQGPFQTFTGSTFRGTLSFTSTVPIGVVALRTYTNANGDFLMSSLPVIDISAMPNTGTAVLPHFADGAGWFTQILLVNPTEATLSGTAQFLNDNGAATNVAVGGQVGSTFPYSIAPRSSQRIATSGAGPQSSGSVRIVPANGGTAPTALLVFSYSPLGIVTSEAGVTTTSGSAFRMYAESSGSPGQSGNIQTGVAVANGGDTSAKVTLELTNLDGSTAGLPAAVSINIAPHGHAAKFLSQIFTGLPSSFKGVLRISTTAGISVVGLRSRFNERPSPENFLITTTPPALENVGVSSSELLFPDLVDGGGYTTQLILFSRSVGQNSSGNLQFVKPDGTSYSPSLN